MGLLDWLRPKKLTRGPTPEGLYGGGLPAAGRNVKWGIGADPAGPAEDFVPYPGAYVFQIVEWTWTVGLLIKASTEQDGAPEGFTIAIGLSDGTLTDCVETWTLPGLQGPKLKEREEWTIPRGHPTREIILLSQGAPTTRMLRKLEHCFGCQPFSHPALPESTALLGELLMLRGIVNPAENRFTARMKVVLPEENGWPELEFFLNINSIRKQLWVSEKDSNYRAALLTRISDLRESSQDSL